VVDVHRLADGAELLRIEEFRRMHPLGQDGVEQVDVALQAADPEIPHLEHHHRRRGGEELLPGHDHEHVGGRDVLVDVARLVDEVDGLEQIAAHRGEPGLAGEIGRPDQVHERGGAALDDQVEGVAALEGVVDVGDVGVAQRLQVLQLREPLLPDLLVGPPLRQQHLGHQVVAPLVGALEDGAEVAVAGRAAQRVAPAQALDDLALLRGAEAAERLGALALVHDVILDRLRSLYGPPAGFSIGMPPPRPSTHSPILPTPDSLFPLPPPRRYNRRTPSAGAAP